MQFCRNEKLIKLTVVFVAFFLVIGLMSTYLMYRTNKYEIWNELAYFEIGIMVACGIVMLLLVAWLVLKDELKYERVFFALVLSLGIIYMLVITPLSGPDEHYHYGIAYKLSNYLAGEGGSELVYEDFELLTSHSNTEGGYIRVLEDFGRPQLENIEMGLDDRKAGYFGSYIPQTIGIILARMLNANFITLFLMGRFTNLLFYAVCIYYAIKTIPRFKALLGVISIMPMALHQAASFSSDTFINGLFFLMVAYAFKLIWADDIIEKRDLITIVILAMLLAPAKVVYCSVFLLFFFIKSNHFSGRKGKLKFLATMISVSVSFALVFQLPSIFSMASHAEPVLNWEGQYNYSLSYVLTDPIQTVKIFIKTIIYYYKIWLYQAIGSTLSGLSLPVSPNIIRAYLLAVVLCAFLRGKEDNYYLDIPVRIASLVVAGAIVFLTMLAMFLGWTSITRDMIEGVQGRYFIPVIPLLAIQFSNKYIKLPFEVVKPVVVFATGLNVLVIAEVLGFTIQSIVR